jgi:putative ABC transport system substrate-binding protein
MKRRDAIVAIALLANATGKATAQQPGKVRRVGVMHAGSSKEAAAIQREPFERGLRELGWNPGSNVLIDYRYGEGSPSRLADQAADLVKSGVDVIVARGPGAIRAVRRATTTIPIVMSAGEEGFVKSMSRPGGNVTGIASLVFDLDSKRLELLREAFPDVRRVAILTNPNTVPARDKERMAALHTSGRSMKLEVEVFEIRRADELARVSEALARGQIDALLVRGDPQVLDPSRSEIVAIAAKYRIPAVYPWRFFVEVGGLMSYGTNLSGFHYRSASYVNRILRGANPADLPVEQPTKFDLVVNLKTAKALGLQIPKAVLFRADELIE